MMPPVLAVDPNRPQRDVIGKAAAILGNHGVVILPTSGLYGLGGDAFSDAAVERIFQIKNRPAEKPLLVLISRRRMLTPLVDEIPPLAGFFMKRFWPGKMTLVMAGRKDLPAGICSAAGKVGVRRVIHPVAAALVDAVGGPVTGTSANLSGKGGCASIDAVDLPVMAAVNMVLDAGVLKGGPGSTVVDVTGDLPVVLRAGAVPKAVVMQVYKVFAASRVDKGS